MTILETPLVPFADGVWTSTEPVRIVGTRLTATMTVLRLADGGLLLYSPVSLTPERRAAVKALGPVTHLYAPNLFHHLRLGDWADAFPAARVHAPRGLSKKRPELRLDRVHQSSPEYAFEGVLDEVCVAGCRLRESVLFYRPAGTLVVADLLHNVGKPEQLWAQVYTRMMGFYDRAALSRVLRWTAFSDRLAARQSVDQLLQLPFDRLIVGHGVPLESGGKEALRAAFEWL
jgi:Domain of unknown function (DUF4336)